MLTCLVVREYSRPILLCETGASMGKRCRRLEWPRIRIPMNRRADDLLLDLESPLLLGDYAPAPPASPPAFLPAAGTRGRASSI